MPYQGTPYQYNPFGDFDPFSEENNGLVKWIGDASGYWGSDRGQYQFKAILDKISGGMLSLEQKMDEMDDALDSYGKTWADVLEGYPYKTLGWSATGSAFSAGLNFVSSNISRLYR